MDNLEKQPEAYEKLYAKADELDAKRLSLGLSLSQLARLIPSYSGRSIEQFKRYPSEKLLGCIGDALEEFSKEVAA